MAGKGPSRLPTAILEARGSWKAKGRGDNAPEFSPVADECPEWMSDEGKAYWLRYAPVVRASRVMTEADWGAFCALCLSWIRLTQSPVDHKDAPKFSSDFRNWCREFGLTPSARASVKVTPAKDGQTVNAKDRFFQK